MHKVKLCIKSIFRAFDGGKTHIKVATHALALARKVKNEGIKVTFVILAVDDHNMYDFYNRDYS